MSPTPQTKAAELSERLSQLLNQETRHDLEIFFLKQEFTKIINLEPLISHTALAMIEDKFYNNEKETIYHYQKAIVADPKYAVSYYNFAVVLVGFGHYEDARKNLQQALVNINNDICILPDIARLASALDMQEIFHEIIEQSNKHNVTSEEIHAIAYEIALANAEDEDDYSNVLKNDNIFEDAVLLSTEEWNDIENLYNELSDHE